MHLPLIPGISTADWVVVYQAWATKWPPADQK